MRTDQIRTCNGAIGGNENNPESIRVIEVVTPREKRMSNVIEKKRQASYRCIGKWQKKLARLNKLVSNPRYGHLMREEKRQIPIVQEAIDDLTRLIP